MHVCMYIYTPTECTRSKNKSKVKKEIEKIVEIIMCVYYNYIDVLTGFVDHLDTN